MKKAFGIYLFFLLLSIPVFAGNPDSVRVDQSGQRPACRDHWIAWDKFHHFTTSALLVCAGSAGAHQTLGYRQSESEIWGIGISFSLGLSKEFHDMRQPGNHFCWKDVAADILGIGFGIWIMERWR